ncbi:hypothetical protein [Candidatus Electronema sp. TJ]|uniref:hypothetical protein n=1 Tax=Candidatus Electronema sp. TJ TaxID=3401573 RepID=UPI003AA92633
MTQRLAVCLFVLLECACPGRLQAAPLLEIAALQWCGDIAADSDPQKNKEPVQPHENGGLFSGQKLHLWMKVKGGQEALNVLRSGGKLGIIQRWRYQRYGAQTDTIDVSIGGGLSEELIRKLQQEVDQRGYFDWRTWGVKENLKAAEYKVDFVNAFYSPLSCALPQGCAMKMRIR